MNVLISSRIDTAHDRPRVVIVGRPNVGKSTLFNRFLGMRRSITDSMPGVTRDPVEETCTVADNPIILIDTGGFKLERDKMDDMVAARIFRSLERAAVVLFVVDITELTLEDEEFCGRLRPYGDKVILVVNKMDHEVRDNLLWNHHSLGFADVVGVSAAHGRGMEDLEKVMAAKFARMRESAGAAEGDDRAVQAEGSIGDMPGETAERESIHIAILGKPNTGKSTLLNVLTDSDLSLVSDIPGTTRDVIEGTFAYKGREFRILDTAGIRRKNKVTDNVEYYSVHRAFGAIERADVVYLLADASEEVSDQDKKIAEQAVKRGKGIIILLNKWDVRQATAAAGSKPPSENDLFNAVRDRVRFLFPILGFAPLLAISALNRTGIEKLLNVTVTLYRQLYRSVDTPKLNTYLKRWLAEYSPPRDKAIEFKPRYITQTSVNPVKFLLFVNRAKGFPEGWIQYLKNKLRKEAGFDLIPFSVDLKQS